MPVSYVQRRHHVAIILSGAAVAVALLNAILLAYVVGGPDQDRILVFGLLLAIGPTLILGAIVFGLRWLAVGAGIVFAAACFVTGFTVGFWNLLIGVPLCAIAIALFFTRREQPEKLDGTPRG
ncbi:MAG TPA: hypothetical protein VGB18_09780 [Candidatus Thermoplasmatota archaeon]